MKTTPDDPARTRRRLISLFCAGVAFLVLAAIGVYGLVTGPNDTGPSPDRPPVPTRSTPDQPTPRLPHIAPSTDPEEFARSAAHALFTWDATSGFLPLDHTAVLLDVGDPTGNEQAGLASDVTSYLPDRDAWVDLRQYSTSQHLAITDAYVPEQWAGAVEQARPGQLPVGATAITIEGTRHREGIWNDEPVTSEHQVVFTIFLACPPDTPPTGSQSETGAADAGEVPSCYLLRLSMLDQPLR
ncbi:hypothetical protein [Pseudoclavibacter helvolus]|uniref:Uncharacterized protein n=1 Tax=Pseudoclavibacter helvolus TaxID=255205 RepID=A0A7W4YDD1_9MICO|nr:hypothetical protein [Pseudoclavibacter helvolus]MBB2955967.1 hypothetical protein [Pseudoclavibacter helvolus]